MDYISDLHIHSRFSRACSKYLTIESLEKWARIKGVNLLGCGDFTHPEWIKEIKSNLTDNGKGIFLTKTNFPFILSSEISLIYTQDNKGRRVHLVLLAPSLDVVDKITSFLLTLGRIDYDGRPIFKLSCRDMTKKLKEISEEIEIIPAHIWTPWFSLFGSKSGFNTVDEAFGDQSHQIYALETGLSSDPEMNWTISGLDKYQLVSFSDSHSYWPWRLGREATILDLEELSYQNIIKALRTGGGLKMTIEVDPSYGKYHIDGHRNCGIELEPSESIKINNICPVCKKPLTIGVLQRVESLADLEVGRKKENFIPFLRLLPLHELISLIYKWPLNSKKTWAIYDSLIEKFDNEYNILLNINDFQGLIDEDLINAIISNRKGEIKVKPGYDGVYGIPILGDVEIKPNVIKEKKQKDLTDFS